MMQLHWETKDNTFYAAVGDARAVIEKVKRDDKDVFVPQIYDPTGQPVIDSGLWFDNFEEAEVVLVAHLPSLDRHGKTESEYLAALSNALVYARNALTDIPRAHQLRLLNIQHWVEADGKRPFPEELNEDAAIDYESAALNWEQHANLYQMRTEFGAAEIADLGIQPRNPFTYGQRQISRFEIRIVDDSGIILKDYYPVNDFEQAEKRIRAILKDLSVPAVDETHLGYLEFVINICLKRLPADTDLMILVRLRDVMTWMGESLP